MFERMNIWLSTQNYFSDRLPDGESFAYSKTFQTWFLFPKPRTQALLAFIPGSIGFIGLSHFSLHPVPREKKQNCEKKTFFSSHFFDKNLWWKEKICFSGSSCLSSGELNWNWGFSSWLESAEQWQGAQISMLKEICPKNSKIPKNQYQWQGVQMSMLKEICPKNPRLEAEEKCTPLVFVTVSVQYRDHHELHCGTGAT